ncbi:MAG: hypothetical protein AB7V56_06605 [Candidatus Nitrosocosmicus sp.]
MTPVNEKKKERVVTVRMNEEYYNTLSGYAAKKGFTVNSFINSVLESQAEFFIPCSSYDNVHPPKKMFASLFSIADKGALQRLAEDFYDEVADVIRILDKNSELTFSSAITFIYIACKYVAGVEPKIVHINNNDNNISVLVKHSMGENFSYFLYLNMKNVAKHVNSEIRDVKYNSDVLSFTIKQVG